MKHQIKTRAKTGTTRARTTLDAALVLRRFRYGESSLVVHLLTRDHGRVSLLAKGAYRPKSAYCGVLDLFDTLDLGWKTRRGGDLGLLASGSIATRRRWVSTHLGRYRAGLAMLELAGLGAREQHEERTLFSLTEEGLDALRMPDTTPELACALFDLQFLRLQGLTPALDACASCGDRLPMTGTSAAFSLPHGGRLCPACARDLTTEAGVRARIESAPLASIRLAQSLLETPFSHLARIRLDSTRTARVRTFVRRFLEYHLETRPRVWGPLPPTRSRRPTPDRR